MPLRDVIARGRALQLGLLLLAAAQLLGCAQFAAISETMFMMTPQEEVQLGQKLKGEVAKQQRFLTNVEINNYIGQLGQKLWLVSPHGDIAPIQPEFYVIDDEAINAFAIPGGAVYIQTGAIRAAADEAELAGVMAHELGHVVRRHGARAVSHESGVNVVQQILLGGEQGEVTQMVSGLLTQVVNQKYSREDENQADEIAVGTLNRAGFDPEGLRTFFATLKQRYGEQGSGAVATLFASHPPTEERMNHVADLMP